MSERDGKTNTLLIEILIGIVAEIIVVILFFVNIIIPIIIGIIIIIVIILSIIMKGPKTVLKDFWILPIDFFMLKIMNTWIFYCKNIILIWITLMKQALVER